MELESSLLAATAKNYSSSEKFSEENLELASRIVDACRQNDQICSDLHEKLRISPRIDVPTFSGLADPHYSNMENLGMQGIREFIPGARHPIPQELRDQFFHMQCNCCMGLFPEISRAWVSIDSDIFIWNYESGMDLAYFDGLPNTIVAMELVRPKSGVFHPHIQYLLCIATSVDIVLLAVNFSDGAEQPIVDWRDVKSAEMHLLPDPLFKVPLDGTVITDIATCKSGRIFLAGKDGCLYELDYGERGWFKRQCKKINHSRGVMSYLVPSFVSFAFGSDEPLTQIAVDETRHILFTLAETGAIQVFDLGAGADQTSKVTSLSASYIENYAAAIVQTIEPSNFRPCVHIHAIESTESSVLNLVGVTQSGVRLYFSCYYPSNAPFAAGATQESSRPLTLRLLHVRLPPGFTASTMVARPRTVHFSWAEKDAFAFVSVVDDEMDTLWGFSGANFPFQFEMMESVTQLPIRGRVWSVKSSCSSVEYFDDLWLKQWPKCVLPLRPTSVVSQQIRPVEKIIVLTAQGIHEIEKQRPVDILRLLLEEYGPDSEEVKAFFQLHQAEQACEMCVLLACSTTAHDRQNVSEKAVRALFVFGGDAQLCFPQEQNRPSVSSPPLHSSSMADWSQLPGSPVQASTPTSPFRPVQFAGRTSPVHWNYGYNQCVTPLTSGLVQSPPGNEEIQGQHPEIRYSCRHNGLYLSFGRIVGSLWNMRMVVLKPQPKGNPTVESALTSEELTWFLDQLKRLRDFLDQHSIVPSAIIGVSNGGGGMSPAGRSNLNQRVLGFMRTETVDSVSHARQQLNKKHKAEAVNGERQSLIRLAELLIRCTEVLELWKILADHQFGVLVAQLPPDIKGMLAGITLRQLIVKGKELCADLITCLIRYHLSDDATTDEISARLRRVCPALYTNDDATAAKASELLQFARALEEGPRKDETLEEALKLYRKVIHQLNLRTVCSQLQEALCFDGIVEMALCAAERMDPQNLGLAYYKNGDLQREDHSLLRQTYTSRMDCYLCITEQLERLGSGNRDPRISSQMAQALSEDMINGVLRSEDELCHVALYDWMLEKNMAEKLLHVTTPFLESYLRNRAADGGPLTDRLLDLLWKFYEKQGRYLPAARLLLNLAEQQNSRTDLKKRLAHLIRAVMCAKSAPDVRADQGAFLQELEDKLEVGQLQAQILKYLTQLKVTPIPEHIRDAIGRLNRELMDVTQLYTDYADEFNLPECKLAIVHCAGHPDPDLMETLWREIVEKELTLSRQDSPDSRMARLEKKLDSLAKLYSQTDRYFPKEFLVKTLQGKCLENQFQPEYLTRLMELLKISFHTVLNVLNQLYKDRQSPWRKNPRAQSHLLHTVLAVINRFAEEPGVCSTGERGGMIGKCRDAVSFYLVELEGNPSAELMSLRPSFQAVELKLHRLRC